MKKVVYVLALALLVSSTTFAHKKKKKEEVKQYEFTLVKENTTTSVKDPNRSGTC